MFEKFIEARAQEQDLKNPRSSLKFKMALGHCELITQI